MFFIHSTCKYFSSLKYGPLHKRNFYSFFVNISRISGPSEVLQHKLVVDSSKVCIFPVCLVIQINVAYCNHSSFLGSPYWNALLDCINSIYSNWFAVFSPDLAQLASANFSSFVALVISLSSLISPKDLTISFVINPLMSRPNWSVLSTKRIWDSPLQVKCQVTKLILSSMLLGRLVSTSYAIIWSGIPDNIYSMLT